MQVNFNKRTILPSVYRSEKDGVERAYLSTTVLSPVKYTLMPMPFLNGVCRHEQQSNYILNRALFLNGVCRHEPTEVIFSEGSEFLNGVCRHELAIQFG